jgi:hypothetical protein
LLVSIALLFGAPADPRSAPDPKGVVVGRTEAPVQPSAAEDVAPSKSDEKSSQPKPAHKASVSRRGRRMRKVSQINVAVGLAPEAPGTKKERKLLDRLERTVGASEGPKTTVRRLRPGIGDSRKICRVRSYDLVILIGYLPGKREPVIMARDCAIDRELGVRASEAADHPALVSTLWDEHQSLVGQGERQRWRGPRLNPKARNWIIAGVALAAVGVAVGLLVANALRKDKVVLKVGP